MDDLDGFVEKVRAANEITEVIGESEPLRRVGTNCRAKGNDSLFVWPKTQTYKDFADDSPLSQGDVFTWVQWQRRCGFWEALLWLCERAKIEPPRRSEESAQRAVAARKKYDALTVTCRHWVRCLRKSEQALEYCRSRGWTDEAIQQSGVGYVDGDRKGLLGELDLHGIKRNDPAARAVLGIPAGMLIYPHVQTGRVVYVSARMASHTEKRHYNLPNDLVGERQPYYNWVYSPVEDLVVVVEGQADAISLGQWGIPAVALTGVSPSAALLKQLGRHPSAALGLDQDEAGSSHTGTIADALGPMTRLVTWPAHDVNDWATGKGEGGPGGEVGASSEAAWDLIKHAPTWVMVLARNAGRAEGMDQQPAMRRAFRCIAQLDDFAVSSMRQDLAKAMGIKTRQFNNMLKAARGEADGDEEGNFTFDIALPGGYVNDHLFEMVYVPPENSRGVGWDTAPGSAGVSGQTSFVVRTPEGTVEKRPFLDFGNGVRYVPMPPSKFLGEQIIEFPTDLGDEWSEKALIDLIQGTIHKYLEIDRFYERLCAYYVLFTWVYDCFNTVPYLRALGDYGTGKSRLKDVVGAMCYRPIATNAASTFSPTFRTMDRFRGTLLFDEGDLAKSDETSDWVKMFNVGYQRRQGVLMRAGDKNSGFDPEVFVVYGPKILATRKPFEDKALESRCLTKKMDGELTRDDIPIEMPETYYTEEAPRIRNLLLMYRMTHWQPSIEPDTSDVDRSIAPRLNQVTMPLKTIVDDPELRDEINLFIKEYNRELVIERGMTMASKVLEALLALAAQAGGAEEADLSVGNICEKVNWLVDYENYGHLLDTSRAKGERIKARGIGSIIKNHLHLKTDRNSQTRRYQVVWDERRIDALKRRFGLDDELIARTVSMLAELQASLNQMPANEEPPPNLVEREEIRF